MFAHIFGWKIVRYYCIESFVDVFAASGIPYAELIDSLLELAVEAAK